MTNDLQDKVLSQSQTVLRVLPTRWRQKSTGIDMERLLHRCHRMYTQGDVTSQDIWSRYDRHFVGTKCCNV